MMCFKFGSSTKFAGTADDYKKNAEIDKLIRRDKKAMDRNVKILLLGKPIFAPKETAC